jgi:hypothetical protein
LPVKAVCVAAALRTAFGWVVLALGAAALVKILASLL